MPHNAIFALLYAAYSSVRLQNKNAAFSAEKLNKINKTSRQKLTKQNKFHISTDRSAKRYSENGCCFKLD
jgi:hypothetical protein